VGIYVVPSAVSCAVVVYATDEKVSFIPHANDVIPLSPASSTFRWSTFIQKFGRRVQRMEDDGTVNVRKEPERKGITNTEQQAAKIASHRGTKEGFDSDGAAPAAAVVEEEDLYYSNEENADDSSGGTTSSSPNYGSLKQLLPKRPIWTKLDFRKKFSLSFAWLDSHYLVYILNTYVM